MNTMESQQSKLAWLLPAILGGVGLWQANEQSKKQDRAIDYAQSLDERRFALEEPRLQSLNEIIKRLQGLATDYDPQKEIDTSVDYAASKTQGAIEKALRGLNAEYRSSGDIPSNSTEFNVRAQGLTNDIADPLREFAAQQRSTATSRKIGAYQAAMGAPIGQFGDLYQQLSNNALNRASFLGGGDAGGSMGLLAQALQQALKRGGSGGNWAGVPFL